MPELTTGEQRLQDDHANKIIFYVLVQLTSHELLKDFI